MKFARQFILATLLMTSLGARANFDQFTYHSYALQEVLDAIYDASFDFDGVYSITHNFDFRVNVKDGKCTVVKDRHVLNHFARIFDEFRSFYPDEVLPYDEALVDLYHLVSGNEYEKCVKTYDEDYISVSVTQYNSLQSDLWIRVEYSISR
jgi:hypothetical protein